MAKEKYFAITVGPKPGIYFDTYSNIEPMVKGAKGTKTPYKSFSTYSDAEKWLKGIGLPELCVKCSTKEDTELLNSSRIIKSNNALPWEGVPDDASRSSITRQELKVEEPSLIDLKPRSSLIDYQALEKGSDVEQNYKRNKINEPDTSPITHKVREFALKNSFGHLSDDQLRGVQKVNGKALLFAVPGSGKTTVIVARTGYLIYDCNISPDKIMTLTFTKAAAEEMKTRYLKLFARRTERGIPQFRTIHSFCYSVILRRLKDCGYQIPSHTIDGSIIVSDEENPDAKKKITMQKILYDVLKNNGVKNHADASDERIQERLLTYISTCKNRKLSEEQQNCTVSLSKELKVPFKPLFDAYEKELQRYDCMDYDDMLQLSYDGLRDNTNVLNKLREEFKYWSVDEAQDNSLLQYDLLNLLAGEDGNLFMVGDDDQSIYGFRGAEPKALLSLAEILTWSL